jgi:hypothetical protein
MLMLMLLLQRLLLLLVVVLIGWLSSFLLGGIGFDYKNDSEEDSADDCCSYFSSSCCCGCVAAAVVVLLTVGLWTLPVLFQSCSARGSGPFEVVKIPVLAQEHFWAFDTIWSCSGFRSWILLENPYMSPGQAIVRRFMTSRHSDVGPDPSSPSSFGSLTDIQAPPDIPIWDI